MPYQEVPPLAWSGWRLRIPGGPEGGQYHGFIGPDSLGWRGMPGLPAPPAQPAPWDDVWGGTPLSEGQSLSDYVFRSSAEPRPRPNASGGVNVVSAFQTRKTAGYAEAPGNYAALGASSVLDQMMPMHFCPMIMRTCAPGEHPVMDPYCGASCEGGAVSVGATNTVPQPSPGDCSGPNPDQSCFSGNVTPWIAPPISPSPSPTVSATPTAAGAAADPIMSWLSQSSILPGVENLWLALGAAAAGYFLLRHAH